MKIWLPITIMLIGTLWVVDKNPPKRVIGYFSILLAIGLYICWIQLQAGCNFSLGVCYGNGLSEEHQTLRAGFVLLSELSWVTIGVRILLSVRKRLSKKSAH